MYDRLNCIILHVHSISLKNSHHHIPVKQLAPARFGQFSVLGRNKALICYLILQNFPVFMDFPHHQLGEFEPDIRPGLEFCIAGVEDK